MKRQKVSGLLCLLLLFLSTAAHAKIVFSSMHVGSDGLYGVYTMDDDGSNIMPLIESKTLRPAGGAWSPDGKQMLFQRRVKINSNKVLFLMNADGTNVRQLTQNDGSSINGGRFSPDGTSILFSRSIRINEKWTSGIYVLNIKTRKLKEISDIGGIQCDWSPDGKQIVFAMGQTFGKNDTIWLMSTDGHNPRPLIPAPGPGEFATYRSRPRWSPDGKQIVFQQKEYKIVHIPNFGNVPFYKAFRYIICDRNGENIRQLRIPKDWEGSGIGWMDNGKSIVFSAYVGIPLNEPLPVHLDFVYPPCNIYKFHIPTGKITQLTDQPGIDWTVDWISDDVLPVSPEGKMQTQWGKIKRFLRSRSEAFQSLSQNVLFYLQNQR